MMDFCGNYQIKKNKSRENLFFATDPIFKNPLSFSKGLINILVLKGE